MVRNGVYGSADVLRAQEDIKTLFPAPFPLERTLALIKPGMASGTYACTGVLACLRAYV